MALVFYCMVDNAISSSRRACGTRKKPEVETHVSVRESFVVWRTKAPLEDTLFMTINAL